MSIVESSSLGAARALALAGALWLASALGAVAQSVIVDFDDRDVSSCAFGGAERIGDQWSALGVSFRSATPGLAGVITEDTCSGFDRISGHSPPNLVGFVPGLTETPVELLFDPEVSELTLNATNWNAGAIITLTAYDSGGASVDSTSVDTATLIGRMQELRVSGAIARAELATTEGSIAFDDVGFEQLSGAPEPTLYESEDPGRVVDPANAVGSALSGPIDHLPAAAPLLFYQVDDGSGSPGEIRLSWDGAGPRLVVHF